MQIPFLNFFYKTKISLKFFYISILFAILASAFDSLSVLLLLPILKGMIQQSFDFVYHVPVLKNLALAFIPYNTNYFQMCSLFFVVIIVVASTNQLMRYFSAFNMCKFARYSEDKIRTTIFNRYLSFGQAFFDQRNSGILHTTLVNHTMKIANELVRLQAAIISILIIITYGVGMMIISWQLTLCMICFLPLFLIVVHNPLQRLKSISRSYIPKSEKLDLQVSNTLHCMPLIKSCATEESENEKFRLLSSEVKEVQLMIDKKKCMVNPIGRFVMLVVLFCAIFTITYVDMVSIPILMVYFYMLREVLINLNSFTLFKAKIASIDGYISSIFEILCDENKEFVESGSLDFLGLERSIDFNNLNFSYDDTLVLKNIHFTIPKKKTTAIVGASGAGKTTIIKLLLRLYNCPPQTILFDNVDIRKLSTSSLMKHISYVSQDTQLFNDTLRHNITYGTDVICEKEILGFVKQVKLDHLLENFPEGLDTIVGDNGKKLSGGEKQKLAFARALVKNTSILILDEATSSLDSQSESFVQSTIAKSLSNKTIIVIAHRLSTIQNADNIVVLENGSIVEQGNFEELIRAEKYFHRYWEKQNLEHRTS